MREQRGAQRAASTRSLALWVPLVLLAALIFWMYHVLAHKPGGQPIGALEWFFAKTAKRVRSRCHAASAADSMINLSFFPSRRLALYMVRLFLTPQPRGAGRAGPDPDDARPARRIRQDPRGPGQWRCRPVALRRACASRCSSRASCPSRCCSGTLIAFVGLNQHSEVVAMKAAGLSAHQILAPLVVASIGIAGGSVRLQRDRRGQLGARRQRLDGQ